MPRIGEGTAPRVGRALDWESEMEAELNDTSESTRPIQEMGTRPMCLGAGHLHLSHLGEPCERHGSPLSARNFTEPLRGAGLALNKKTLGRK